MRPPPAAAPEVFAPPSACISPAPLIVPASMRMLPPAPEESEDSPFARILPLRMSEVAKTCATPPPERHGVHVVPAAGAPAPPGVFGLNTEPNDDATLPVHRPP